VAAVLAAILFAIAFVLHGAGGHVPAWFAWQGVTLIGLVLLALHAAGLGPNWPRRG
jgi:hypothetical protein